jgi:hypothetical protein
LPASSLAIKTGLNAEINIPQYFEVHFCDRPRFFDHFKKQMILEEVSLY